MPWLIGGIVSLTVLVVINWAWQKTALQQVIRFGAARGWEMQVIDSFNAGGHEIRETNFRVRFRDRDGTLVEGVLVPRSFSIGDFLLTKGCRIPKDVEKGMFDKRVAMDCRKCGTTVPAGAELCPYCKSPRDILRIA